jgi:hypothetical protein
LNNDDKKLQIELAQLQTDVQIHLTVAVSFLAIWITLIVSFQQLFVQATEPFQQFGYVIGVVISALLGFISTSKLIDKMKNKRTEMEKLKDKYIK